MRNMKMILRFFKGNMKSYAKNMKFNIKQYILNSNPFLLLTQWSKKISFPGFDRLPLYYVVSYFLITLVNTTKYTVPLEH